MGNSSSARPLTDFGALLHRAWEAKHSLASSVSTNAIDALYARGRSAGALGGKLLGAGGGGFMVFSAPKARHPDIIKRLSHLRHVNFGFENMGTSIVFYQ